MKITQKLASGAVLELETDSVKDAVKQFAAFQEVFSEQTCGKCGQNTIACNFRKDSEGHEYYSLKCSSCGCELSFGQYKVGGGLFSKRSLPDGKYDREHRGWKRYERQEEGGQPAQQQPQRGGGQKRLGDDNEPPF